MSNEIPENSFYALCDCGAQVVTDAERAYLLFLRKHLPHANKIKCKRAGTNTVLFMIIERGVDYGGARS